MKTRIIMLLVGIMIVSTSPLALAQEDNKDQYRVGVNDVLTISILQPDEFKTTVTVSPDGAISFPYIGRVEIKGLTMTEIRDKIEQDLSNGYMKYPTVLVTLEESRSRRFFVYGEVIKPGAYSLTDNTTVLRAISMAGGFTKFGSSSHVKVLRPRKNRAGYDTIKINLKLLMSGAADADMVIQPGDMIVISEGVF